MSGQLILSQTGQQLIANANAGGLLVKPLLFKVSNSSTPASDQDTDVGSTPLYSGAISYVEVISPKTAKFTFDLPDQIVGIDAPFTFQDIGLWGEGMVFMARGVFDSKFEKSPGIGIRLNCLMTTTNCDLTSIDVTIGDYTSIPSTQSVENLPNPSTSTHNAVVVLSMNTNTDGDLTAGIAMKNHAGAYFWGFSGYDKIFSGMLTEAGAISGSPQNIRLPVSIMETTSFVDEEVIIIQAISGGAANGESRQAQYNESIDKFLVQGSAFPYLSEDTVVNVWQKIRKSADDGTTNPCTYPPSRSSIPADYVLTRGQGTCPEWQPPSAATSIASTLYRPPGLMQLDWQTFSGDGRTRTFDIGTRPENVKFLVVSIGGVFQHRNTFELNDTKLTFSENIPPNIEVQVIRVYNDLSVSAGAFIEVHTKLFSGDGSTRAYSLSNVPVDGDGRFLMITVDGFLQHSNSYTYSGGQLQFSESPPPNAIIETTVFSRTTTPGYSMDIVAASYVTSDFTDRLELPVVPESKDNVFVSYSGILINRSAYSISGSVLYFQADELSTNPVLYKGQPLEVTIFHNRAAEGGETTNLNGLVVDAVPGVNSIRMLRHGAPAIDIPMPRPVVKSGDHIAVVDNYPEITIHSTIKEGAGYYTGSFKYSTKHTMEDAEELIYVYPLKFNQDITLLLTADFSVRLGPNFRINQGNEVVEYSVGFRHDTHKEPPYNRRIKGTGSTGITWLPGGHFAYGNASVSTTFEFLRSNITSGLVELVARCRVRNALISEYNSLLEVDFSLIGVPRK
jgi:hypothetical protein